MPIAFTLALLLGATTPAASQSAPTLSAAEWREDLHTLAVEMPLRHRNAFARMARQRWDSAVAALDARIPSMHGYEVKVAFARLVALVNDGHTTLAPDGEDRMGFGRLPIELYDFSDGVYIVAADSAHANLVGARVLRIGGAPIAAAMDSAAFVVSHESPDWVKQRAPSMLVVPEVLAAFHLADSAQATFELQMGQTTRSVVLRATRPSMNVIALGAPLPPGWHTMAGSPPALWLQHADSPWWFTMLPDHTLYVSYRGVLNTSNGETNEAFFHRAFAAGDSAGMTRAVLDIRTNGGGNNFMSRNVVKEIVRRPALDQQGSSFVIIGRGTFSAAQSLVNELSYYTNATFVGEPTGNAPNQYGDNRPLELPHSHLRVRISSLLWESHSASDDRPWFPPAIYAELSSSDYRAARDPVLDAALGAKNERPLATLLRPAADKGDAQAVAHIVDSIRAEPRNRFRPLEREVNAVGYELLGADHTDPALAVFRANTLAFPTSANTFDSLGEALERANKRDEAIAAYRRAVALDPRLASSASALQRLGASPKG